MSDDIVRKIGEKVVEHLVWTGTVWVIKKVATTIYNLTDGEGAYDIYKRSDCKKEQVPMNLAGRVEARYWPKAGTSPVKAALQADNVNSIIKWIKAGGLSYSSNPSDFYIYKITSDNRIRFSC